MQEEQYTAPRIKIYNYEQIEKDQDKFEEVFSYIKMYGSHTMAYSILQPKMNYFIIEGIGIIAYAKYKKHSKTRYVLGDPLVSNENRKLFLKEFLKAFPKTYFVQISKITAITLNELNSFYATPLGIETYVDMEKFEIEGSEKRKLRNNIRNCKKELKVFEDKDLENINHDEIEQISNEWLLNKKDNKKEINFLARPLKLIKEKDTRMFLALKEKKIVGFIIFNPIYVNNKISGYTADIVRDSKDSPRGTSDYILYLALKKFRREGIFLLSLGLSPFADLDRDDIGIKDDLTFKLAKLIYYKAESLYHFQGLADHKKQFQGIEDQVYFSHKNKFPIFKIFQLFKICNII